MSFKGHHHTAEANAKNAAAHTGRTESAETRAKISASRPGYRNSPETRAKLAISMLGNTNGLGSHNISTEGRAKMGAARWNGGYLLSGRRHEAKRRALGYHTLNGWFVGCEGHHINLSDVIYIPEAMHDSVKHNIWTGKNMEKINALAGAFFTEDLT